MSDSPLAAVAMDITTLVHAPRGERAIAGAVGTPRNQARPRELVPKLSTRPTDQIATQTSAPRRRKPWWHALAPWLPAFMVGGLMLFPRAQQAAETTVHTAPSEVQAPAPTAAPPSKPPDPSVDQPGPEPGGNHSPPKIDAPVESKPGLGKETSDPGEPNKEARKGTPAVKRKLDPASEQCRMTREKVGVARNALNFHDMLRLLNEKGCWQSKDEHGKLKILAYKELGNFGECAEAGRGNNDPEAVKWVRLCAKRADVK